MWRIRGQDAAERRDGGGYSLRDVEIEGALERAHRWSRNQEWWSDEEDTITSVKRPGGAWVVDHMSRRFADAGDRQLGGFGPLTVTDDGEIIPPERSLSIDDVSESGIGTTPARTLKKPRLGL
jgi:hypothetical protein